MRTGRRDVFVVHVFNIWAQGIARDNHPSRNGACAERLDEMKSLEDAMLEPRNTPSTCWTGGGVPATGDESAARQRPARCRKFTTDITGAMRGIGLDALPAARLHLRRGENQVSPAQSWRLTRTEWFARLLGMAAASNIILGRAEIPESGGRAIFDVGDEIVGRTPMDCRVGDCGGPTRGEFVGFEGPLEGAGGGYAASVPRRLPFCTASGGVYRAFSNRNSSENLFAAQDEYRSHKRGFRPAVQAPAGERARFAASWACVVAKRMRMPSAGAGGVDQGEDFDAGEGVSAGDR